MYDINVNVNTIESKYKVPIKGKVVGGGWVGKKKKKNLNYCVKHWCHIATTIFSVT